MSTSTTGSGKFRDVATAAVAAANDAAERAKAAERRRLQDKYNKQFGVNSNPNGSLETRTRNRLGNTARSNGGDYDDDFEAEENEEEEEFEEGEEFEEYEEGEEEEAAAEETEEEEEEDEEEEEEVAPKRKPLKKASSSSAAKTMPVKLVRTSDGAVKTFDLVENYTPTSFTAVVLEIAKKCGTDAATTTLKAADKEGDLVDLDDARAMSRLLSERWPGKFGNPSTISGSVLRILVSDASMVASPSMLMGSATSPIGTNNNINGTISRNPFDQSGSTSGNTIASQSSNGAFNTLRNAAQSVSGGTFRTGSSTFLEGTMASGLATIKMPTTGEPLQWTKIKLLGRGSFGTVHEGITNDGKLMAVKVVELAKEKVMNENDSDVRALQAEISLMTQLKHPYIVAYYGCQTIELDNGAHQFEIFMEDCHGGSLTSLRKKFSPTDGKLKITLVRHYTRQILQGLKYLHENHVIHRDIKSDNVLISASGEAKLADFGCSKQLSTATVSSEAGTQTVVGSPLFMAPEVLTGTDEGYSFSADVWSVGCLLLELLGRKPWLLTGSNPYQLMFQISQSKSMPTGVPENCPEMLKDFFSRLFERDAAKRATPAELLQHEWMTCADNMLVEVDPPSEAARTDIKK